MQHKQKLIKEAQLKANELNTLLKNILDISPPIYTPNEDYLIDLKEYLDESQDENLSLSDLHSYVLSKNIDITKHRLSKLIRRTFQLEPAHLHYYLNNKRTSTITYNLKIK